MTQKEEFLKQLDRKIARLQQSLEDAKGLLIDYAKTDASFGLARYAEDVTKIMVQLEVLKDQREIFAAIFE